MGHCSEFPTQGCKRLADENTVMQVAGSMTVIVTRPLFFPPGTVRGVTCLRLPPLALLPVAATGSRIPSRRGNMEGCLGMDTKATPQGLSPHVAVHSVRGTGKLPDASSFCLLGSKAAD